MPKPIHLLLVDDEELFVKNLTQVLRRRGMVVEGAENGAVAIELISSRGAEFYDVIVLDMKMPGMNGLTTLCAIRQRNASVPVILLTGHADLKDVSQALKEGVQEVLLKPCPIDSLVATIENAHERMIISCELSRD